MRATSSGWCSMTARRRRSRICCRIGINWVDEFAWSARLKSDLYFYREGEAGESPISRTNLSANLIELCYSRRLRAICILRANTKSLIAARMTVAAIQPRCLEFIWTRHHIRMIEMHKSGSVPVSSDLSNPHDSSQITHLNDALLAQLDLPEDGILLVHRRGRHQAPGLPHSAAGLRRREEIPGEVPDPRRPAGRMGRFVVAIAGMRSCLPPTAMSWS